jgi:hypothetical protein
MALALAPDAPLYTAPMSAAQAPPNRVAAPAMRVVRFRSGVTAGIENIGSSGAVTSCASISRSVSRSSRSTLTRAYGCQRPAS